MDDQSHITPKTVNPGRYNRELQVHINDQITPETQKKLNQPLSDQGSKLSAEDEAFLKDIIQKVESKQIDLYKPSTILNQNVYDTLSGANQAKTDLFLQATLGVLRQIYSFYYSDHTNDSYMMQSMIRELRIKKETLEKEIGDVLKI